MIRTIKWAGWILTVCAATGGQADFDAITLDASPAAPEPSAGVLLGSTRKAGKKSSHG